MGPPLGSGGWIENSAEYRAAGWSTASSEVESAHRHTVQCRLKIPGAWWHPHHVDDILVSMITRIEGLSIMMVEGSSRSVPHVRGGTLGT